MEASPRILRLREKAIEPVICYDEMYLHFYERYAQNEALNDIQLRFADAYAYGMDRVTPCIGQDELIVGKSDVRLTPEQAERYAALQEQVAEKVAARYGQDSHMTVDYDAVLQLGLAGLCRRISDYESTASAQQTAFYSACRTCLQAIVRFSNRYADAALQLAAAEPGEQRKQELLQIARVCKTVPENPASNFYEAVQSVNFITFCLMFSPFRYFSFQQFQLGRPDRYLLPYYTRDRQQGTLTPQQAQELCDCLAIQIDHHVPHGLSCGYMVGGRDEAGKPVVNDLTRIFLQVIDNVRLVYPSVGLCQTKDTPKEFLQLACQILSHGRSHPAIFNDEIIQSGLRYYGVPAQQACSYIHSTCVEITPIACSNVWVASPYTNMAQLLLEVLEKGGYADMQQLLQEYFQLLDAHIEENFQEQNNFRRMRVQNSCNPVLSCFVNDCLQNGLDIERGGARYNWIMPSFVGMANLADSLYAIEKLVFDKKVFDLPGLVKMLQCNFEGCEPQRLLLQNGVEKYGNNVQQVDDYFALVVNHIVQACARYTPILPNARLIPSVFCWVKHEQFGSVTGATPDGRKAGFPLGDGSGPCQGREHNGPTASILSSTKWSHKELIGGVAVNMKFSKKVFTENSCSNMLGLVQTYLQRGGFELQINVLDRDTLLAAQKNPEQYRDLIVRIGGYSDYFVRISPAMQAEVLLRTEHEI